MNQLPMLADLEVNLKDCDKVIGAIIDIRMTEDQVQQLYALAEALEAVRTLQVSLADWVENAKRAGYPQGSVES